MRPVPTRPESAWRMVRGRGAGFAALLCALLAASLVAAGDDNYPTGDPVIPPGEEELIGTMLGKGTALDHCALISGGVEYTTIKATYRCLGGEVRLELANLRNARASSTQTGQFAITVKRGSPPPGFRHALAALVRSQEDKFEWSWPESAAQDENADEGGAE